MLKLSVDNSKDIKDVKQMKPLRFRGWISFSITDLLNEKVIIKRPVLDGMVRGLVMFWDIMGNVFDVNYVNTI